MPSPREGEREKEYISRCMSSEEAKRDFPDSKQRVAFCHSKWRNKGKSSGAVFVYEDPKTGELFHYSRRGTYRKNGRTLVFIKQSRGEIMSDHILNRAAQSFADEKAGYPPNCNEGYVAKDGKCVPAKENTDAFGHPDKNGDDEEKNGNDKKKKKNGNDKKKNGNDKKKNGNDKKM